ncbi:MAG: hypothetical protein RJB37_3602, partial [Pseudomonadota bacterium]
MALKKPGSSTYVNEVVAVLG